MLPWPFGLAAATRLYTGSAPTSVRMTRISVAIGASAAGGEKGDARLVAERREVVDAGEAHDLPPGGMVHRGGVGSFRHLTDALKEPLAEMRAARALWLGLHRTPSRRHPSGSRRVSCAKGGFKDRTMSRVTLG